MKFAAHVIEPVGGHGGMNYYNSGLANGLTKSGYQAYLYTCDRTKENTDENFFIEKPFKGIWGNDSKAIRFFRFIRGTLAAGSAIKRRKSRFAHLHFFEYNLKELMPCLFLKFLNLKIVATVHDIEAFSSNEMNPFQQLMFRLVDEYIVHNSFSKDQLIRSTNGRIKSKQVSIIHHGNYIPYIETPDKEKARKALNLDTDSPVILFFGQIKEVKGLDILIDAAKKVTIEFPNAQFVVAGKVWKDSFEKYATQIEKLGLNDNFITQIKYIPDEHVHNYYNSADVVAIPYRNIYQSGVLLMAMSYACTTVSSDLPAMREIVKDRINGYLFKTGSSDSLADTLIEALQGDIAKIGQNAKETMLTDYDWTDIARQHIEVYERLSH